MNKVDEIKEDIKSFLKKDEEGANLYEHLQQLILKLSLDNSDSPYESFETYSKQVKEACFKSEHPPDNQFEWSEDFRAKELDETCREHTLLLMKGPPEDDNNISAEIESFTNFAHVLKEAGVGFGDHESYLISLSLRKLAAKTEGLSSLRFWGKILGIQADYYVSEGKFSNPDTSVDSVENSEPHGIGANEYSYWICNDVVMDEWEMLPDVLPHHIIQAKKVQKLLTGKLSAPVITFPHFQGSERHFLRAQIARISHGTILCPSALYEADEGELMLKEDAEADVDLLSEQTAWHHARPILLNNGKIEHTPLTEEEEESSNAELLLEERENDPTYELLSRPNGIEDDSFMGSGDIAWSVQQLGDKAVYANGCFGCIAVKSWRWPGAVCMGKPQSNLYGSIYVGNGLKAGEPPFFPTAPGDVMSEPSDLEEQPEPYPLESEDLSDKKSVCDTDEEEEKDEDEEEDE
eukprot:Platyproteum_vivax@DN7385_c0_g1_i3.p1